MVTPINNLHKADNNPNIRELIIKRRRQVFFNKSVPLFNVLGPLCLHSWSALCET